MPDIGGGFSRASEQFVNGIEEGPCAAGFDGDVAIEFSGCCEGILLTFEDWIFEPVPVFWCTFAKHKTSFAIGVIAIPVGVAECLVDAGAIEAMHQCCNRRACARCRGVDVWPGG